MSLFVDMRLLEGGEGTPLDFFSLLFCPQFLSEPGLYRSQTFFNYN